MKLAERVRKHSDHELSLRIKKEQAMALDITLEGWRNRTARVQVNVTYEDDNGRSYHATRIIRMRVKGE